MGDPAFWDETVVRDFRPREFSPETFLDGVGLQGGVSKSAFEGFLRLIGPVDGLNLLDIGCGNGFLAVYLAQLGATVTAIDNSTRAVENTAILAEVNGVQDRVHARSVDALALADLGETFHVVTGVFILHHVEPLDRFAGVLREAMMDGGRAVFYENSSSNPLLMFFRAHVVGRFGIPKFRDEHEVPLEVREIALLEREFSRVEVHFPGVVLFELVARYLFRDRPAPTRITKGLDRLLYRIAPLRRWSYHQVIELQR